MNSQKKLIIILIAMIPLVVWSQSKPQRNKAFDKTVVEKKENSPNLLSTSKKKKQYRRKGIRSYKKRKQAPMTYLSVDGYIANTSLNKYLTYEAQYLEFLVSSNRSVSVESFSSWFRSKRNDRGKIVISVDENMSETSRSGFFMINAGNKWIRANITQNGKPFAGKATIHPSICLSHNIQYNHEKNIMLSAYVTIYNAKGRNCHVVAFVSDGSGMVKGKPHSYPNYSMGSVNLVFTPSQVICPTYNSETFPVVMYLPNNAMDLSRKNNHLKLLVYVYCEGQNKPLTEEPYIIDFFAKKEKRGITTEPIQ